MKGAMRLAQSLYPQAIEKIRFFDGFSRPPKADSEALKKRDSPPAFAFRKSGFLAMAKGHRRDAGVAEKRFRTAAQDQ
jgi:hypothetical protein